MNYIEKIENIIKNKLDKITTEQRYAFVTTFIVGIIAHGFILFNRISYHDNSACLFSLGGTYESGRWMLGIIYDLQMMSTKLFSVPVFNGLLSIFFIAIAAMLVIDIFDIKSKLLSVYIAAIMVAYPVVTAIFSYMFTAWEYLLGMLLSVCAARILVKRRKLVDFFISAFVLSCSLGFYQAFFAVTIVIYLLSLTLNVIKCNVNNICDYIKQGLMYLSNLVCGLVLWEVIRRLSLIIKGINVVDYKGMNDAYDISMFPSKIVLAYTEFFHFRQEKINTLFYLRVFTGIIVIIALVQLLILLIKSHNEIGVKLVSLIGIILLPLGMNVVYILSTSEEYLIDTLMMYGNIFVYIIPIVLMGTLTEYNIDSKFIQKSVLSIIGTQAFVSLVVLIGYVYLDNAAYFKADLTQQAAVAWCTELVANIKGTDGFDDDMEIVFVGWDNLDDGTFAQVDNMEQLEAIQIAKYPDYRVILETASNMYFLREHIAFGNDKVIIDDGTLANKSIVKSMPTYPNSGGIKVVDDKIIVKIGE